MKDNINIHALASTLTRKHGSLVNTVVTRLGMSSMRVELYATCVYHRAHHRGCVRCAAGWVTASIVSANRGTILARAGL